MLHIIGRNFPALLSVQVKRFWVDVYVERLHVMYMTLNNLSSDYTLTLWWNSHPPLLFKLIFVFMQVGLLLNHTIDNYANQLPHPLVLWPRNHPHSWVSLPLYIILFYPVHILVVKSPEPDPPPYTNSGHPLPHFMPPTASYYWGTI